MPEYKAPNFISVEAFDLLLGKLKEVQDMFGIAITKFSFTFPLLKTIGLPLEITVSAEMLE